MKIILIIRGPAGIGKTTISKLLTKKLEAKYYSYDKILQDNNIDKIVGNCIPLKNFIEANKIILKEINSLNTQKFIILDGCFYHKDQLDHLKNNYEGEILVFDLKASLDTAIKRNVERGEKMPQNAVRDVYKLVSKTSTGIPIDTEGLTKEEIIELILNKLN